MRGTGTAEAGIDFRLPPSHLGQASGLDDSRFGVGLGGMRTLWWCCGDGKWLERSRVIRSVPNLIQNDPNLVEQVYQLIVKEDQAGQQGAGVLSASESWTA